MSQYLFNPLFNQNTFTMKGRSFTSMILLAVFALCVMTAKADETFRNHRYSSFKALPECQEGDIVFIGNSITNMMNWFEAFGSQQNIHGRGNSGGYTQEILDNLESMIAGNPSKVFLMIGTNDLGTSGSNYTPELTAERIQLILSRIRAEVPGATVYYQSILPSLSGLRTKEKTETTNNLVKSWIEKKADNKIVYIDLYSLMVADNGAMKNTTASASTSSYSWDGLHLTQKGYRVWMEAIKEHVGHECVYPATADNIFGGLTGSNGMRVTYFGASPVKTTDILLIGDEMIHNGEWHELLGSADFKDRGIGWGFPSLNVSSVAGMFDAILSGNTDKGVSKTAPRAVCMYTGLTDVQAGTDAATIFANYQTAVNNLRSKLPDTPIFVMTVLPYPSSDAAKSSTIVNLNNSLKTLANDDNKIYIIDAYGATYGTSRDEASFMGTGNIYLSGLGYAKVAQAIATTVNEKLNTTFQAVTTEEAQKNIDRFALRTAAYSYNYEAGTELGYYEPEAVATFQATIQNLLNEFNAGTGSNYESRAQEAQNTMRTALVLPSDENTANREFQLYTPNRGHKYMTSTGRGKGVKGTEKNNYNTSRWTFVHREDGKWDIRNVGDLSYLSPVAGFNTQIKTSKTAPETGWEFSYCNSAGLYIIQSGNVQLNQTNKEDAVYNWSSSGNASDRADAGCQFKIVDVTDIPADIVEEPVYPSEAFQITVTKDNGKLYRAGSAIESGWGSLWTSTDGLLNFSCNGVNNMQWNGKNIDARSGQNKNASYELSCAEGYYIAGYSMKLTSLTANAQQWVINERNFTTSSTTDIQTVSEEELQTSSILMSLKGENTGTLITDFVVTLKSNVSTFMVNMLNGTVTDSRWTSNIETPQLVLSTEENGCGVSAAGNELKLSGKAAGTAYTLQVPEGYVIDSYKFRFSCPEKIMTVQAANEEAVEGSADYAEQVSASDLSTSKVTFTLSGNEDGDITTSEFYVQVTKVNLEVLVNERFTVFQNPSSAGVPYRIPAIAKAQNGDLIAVADYRYSKADIGMATNGKLDLRFRIKDHATGEWGEVKTLAAAKGSGASNIAFGDPCIVADRESNRVMVTSCCGNVSFPGGTHENHQGWARFYSEDGGQTWSDYTDISDQVFEQLDKRSDGNIRCFFIGSGKICQSTTVKVGDYYRIYCAALVKVGNGTNTNYVFYSDDFGLNWKLLGTPDDCPIPSGADEPKAEELPDGSILVSSRIGGGRFYNIYHFTNTETGEGKWGDMATSSRSVNGIYASSNACNGETLCVPVMRKSDSKKMFLLLQSVPFGPSDRSHVGINYKELADLGDFHTPTGLAKDWDGKFEVTERASAYSTMTLDAGNNVAFFYEENYSDGGYDMVYKKYTIEELTNDAYAYETLTHADSTAYMKEAINTYVTNMDYMIGDIVGMYAPEAKNEIAQAQANYENNPCRENYEAFNQALTSAKRVTVEPGKKYYFRNYGRSNANASYVMTLKSDKSYFVGANESTANVEASTQHFSFVATENEGEYLLFHPESQLYYGILGNNETQTAPATASENAGIFRIESNTEGLSKFNNVNHTGSNAYIHLAGDNTRLVPWAGTDPSQWYIIPTSNSVGIQGISATQPDAPVVIYDLAGRRVDNPSQKGVYIVNGQKMVMK